MKINCGCGSIKIEGFINIDIEGNPDLKHDLRDGIPFPDNSIEFINASQFLEHLNFEEALVFLKEAYRVLTPGGIIRISVPDLEILIKGYLDNSVPCSPPKYSYLSKGNRFALTLFGALASDRKRYRGHQHTYDFEALKEVLEMAGFKEIKRVEFDARYDAIVAKDYSLIVEAKK